MSCLTSASGGALINPARISSIGMVPALAVGPSTSNDAAARKTDSLSSMERRRDRKRGDPLGDAIGDVRSGSTNTSFSFSSPAESLSEAVAATTAATTPTASDVR